MHVIVCGGRDIDLTPEHRAWLETQRATLGITKVYHGDTPGIDREAGAWALAAGLAVELYEIEWEAHQPADPLRTNPAAIIQRNRLLKRLRTQADGAPIAILAIAPDRGTEPLLERARALDITILAAPDGIFTDPDATPLDEAGTDLPGLEELIDAVVPATVTLTPHQQAAVELVVQRITDGLPLVAIRGLAGTGKTTLIPALRTALRAAGFPVAVGTPTHRAAMILRSKGIVSADTLHSHALMPYFTADYRRACAWLGEALEPMPGTAEQAKPDVAGLPWLVWTVVQPDLERGRALLRMRKWKPRQRLGSIGIHGKDYFAGFGPKAGQGVLILDEASMVGQKLLALCQEAFRQIILIGDPGQLPPVKDTPALANVEGVELTEIHRQAAVSPIVQLALRARDGERVWLEQLRTLSDPPVGDVCPVSAAPATAFLTAPLIVQKNLTRMQCTAQIRQALGYTKDRLYAGEPLVCRATSQDERAMGFYNNGLYTIVEVFPSDPRQVTVANPLGEESTIIAHLEELDGDTIDPRAIPFRFGYCLTCHTAQGGEWPTVYIDMSDLLKYATAARGPARKTELAQWVYTAITRAKSTLCFLTQHHFLASEETSMAPRPPLAPPSAPFLGAAADPFATPEPTLPLGPSAPVREEPDDIPEPAVPATLVEALQTPQEASGTPPPAWTRPEALPVVQGFLGALGPVIKRMVMDHVQDVDKHADVVWAALQKWIDVNGHPGEHASYQLATALEALGKDGVPLRHDPYEATVEATSPEGFAVRIQLRKADAGALTQALPALTAWLVQAGYTAAGMVPERSY